MNVQNHSWIIFSPLLPLQISTQNNKTITYKHVTTITYNDSIEFVVPGHGDNYVPLPHIMLSVKAKIVSPNGSQLTSADNKVGPVTDFLRVMFSDVEMYLNYQLI